jgi:hypothetical protein
VDKLLIVGFIQEVMYLDWIVNVVVIKKSIEKWRIYVNFINLNKACLNDSSHLSKIDKLMDPTTSFKFLISFNANSGYHRIPMHIEDEKNTSFIIEERTFLLSCNAFRYEKYKSYLPVDGQQSV